MHHIAGARMHNLFQSTRQGDQPHLCRSLRSSGTPTLSLCHPLHALLSSACCNQAEKLLLTVYLLRPSVFCNGRAAGSATSKIFSFVRSWALNERLHTMRRRKRLRKRYICKRLQHTCITTFPMHTTMHAYLYIRNIRLQLQFHTQML